MGVGGRQKVIVTTSWNNRTYQASTDKDGAWLVKVDTPEGGYTPYSITISDGTPVTLSDILIGEVWICSGQSNMEMRMMGNAAQPIDHSLETLLNSGNYRDRIRFITVPRTNDTERRTDFEKRKWEVSSPETSIDCSAAAYFFARQLTESLHLPVGLVINSWGGSAIEAWMDEPTLKTVEGMNIEAAKILKEGCTSVWNVCTTRCYGLLRTSRQRVSSGIRENRIYPTINSMLR